MADMYDCGVHTHNAWKNGEPYYERWLGKYDPAMPVDEVQRRLEHDKLTEHAQQLFERGFTYARERKE